ncbi:bifunctional uridylate/adenylate kinase [Blastocladiella emersonii ATCC 22665]|nr:bifunctional uridylate/adenylate kinase [Blastocladiella emersonii ATCC 22665]
MFRNVLRAARTTRATAARTFASEAGASSSSSSAARFLTLGGAFAVAGCATYYYLNSQDAAKSAAVPAAAAAPAAVAAKTGLPPNSPFKVKPTVVFILGGPGASKGTVSSRLVDDFDFVHLSAGDLLREERNRAGSKVGELINNYIKEGKIVPMEITIKLLETAMLASGKNRFLIDGFPRKMDQADAFEETVAASDFVLYLECPEREMETRLLKRGETSGRVDDNLESIRKRFATFRDTSFPVIEKYRALGKVHQISCLGTRDEVYAKVHAIFAEKFNKA